jgi:hypothetical protein
MMALALSGVTLFVAAAQFDPVDETLSAYLVREARIEFMVGTFAVFFLIYLGVVTSMLRYLWWLLALPGPYYFVQRIGEYGYDKDQLALGSAVWSTFFASRAAWVYLRRGAPDPDIFFPHQFPGMLRDYVSRKWRVLRAYINRRSGAE